MENTPYDVLCLSTRDCTLSIIVDRKCSHGLCCPHVNCVADCIYCNFANFIDTVSLNPELPMLPPEINDLIYQQLLILRDREVQIREAERIERFWEQKFRLFNQNIRP